MDQREEIMTRKNQLKEREARLKDLGKSEETLRKEEMKRLEKELEALRKQDAKEAKKFKIRQEREEKKAKDKAEKEAAEAAKKAKKEKEQNRKDTAKEQQERQNRNVKEMTDDELRAFINRYNMEKQYKEIMEGPKKKTVLKTITDILSKSGQEALGTVSKKAITFILDETLENLSKGKIESDSTKNKRKRNSGQSGGSGAQ